MASLLPAHAFTLGLASEYAASEHQRRYSKGAASSPKEQAMGDSPPNLASSRGPARPGTQPAADSHGDDDAPCLDLERWSIGGYGTAEVSASGVDRSQLRHNLRLTPTERVEQMVAFVRFILPLQGALRHRRD
jgi:hypothetical protein